MVLRLWGRRLVLGFFGLGFLFGGTWGFRDDIGPVHNSLLDFERWEGDEETDHITGVDVRERPAVDLVEVAPEDDVPILLSRAAQGFQPIAVVVCSRWKTVRVLSPSETYPRGATEAFC